MPLHVASSDPILCLQGSIGIASNPNDMTVQTQLNLRRTESCTLHCSFDVTLVPSTPTHHPSLVQCLEHCHHFLSKESGQVLLFMGVWVRSFCSRCSSMSLSPSPLHRLGLLWRSIAREFLIRHRYVCVCWHLSIRMCAGRHPAPVTYFFSTRTGLGFRTGWWRYLIIFTEQ